MYWAGTYIPVFTIFALSFVIVGHSFTYLCVFFFHHFRCLRSLFQDHLTCWSFTLTGPASLHDQHQELLYDILGKSVLSAGNVEPFTYIYTIRAAAFCKYAIIDLLRHKIPTLSHTNYM